MTPIHCECCGRELDPAKTVMLELDQRIGEYHDFGGVPENQSQGGFYFGATCAKRARKRALDAFAAQPIIVQRIPRLVDDEPDPR